LIPFGSAREFQNISGIEGHFIKKMYNVRLLNRRSWVRIPAHTKAGIRTQDLRFIKPLIVIFDFCMCWDSNPGPSAFTRAKKTIKNFLENFEKKIGFENYLGAG